MNRAVLTFVFLAWVAAVTQATAGADVVPHLNQTCLGCHEGESAEGGLDLASLPFDLSDPSIRDRWIRLHDRVEKGEMPPKSDDLPHDQRAELLRSLAEALHAADHADVVAFGRGPLRRLNRDEYEQNLRDVLQLPLLDIRDLLPDDREGLHFNKTTAALDLSRVQLTAYLDAAEAALQAAVARSPARTPTNKLRVTGTNLFPEQLTFGEREAMFFAKDNKALDSKELNDLGDDPAIELALFRSAHWPYYGYPKGFIASVPGEYRVRFSARAVVQIKNYELRPAVESVPMTFRARKPSGPDVSGDVRATGGMHDIQPAVSTYETTIFLREHETFEYSLLGLPVPLARNVMGGPPTYRYPPFPVGGQPGVAFQWLEIEGPLSSEIWPPPSHQVLFDELGVDVSSNRPREDASRLLRRFVKLAAREPVSDDALLKFQNLIEAQLEMQKPFAEALLTGYKAFLSSPYFLYLREPEHAEDHFAVASRLSHFLVNSRPDPALLELAAQQQLRDANTLRRETERLIASDGFERFVKSFTDYWLSLRHIRREDPDVRLYPEYRFDDYLVESMERETRAFFTAMVRENLPARVLVDADFVFANDRLARHYQLPPVSGSALRRVSLPLDSPLGGLLTQGAIMKVTANGTSTSPVVRGAWIMERLIGQPPPPPPASVPAVEPDIRGAKTIRELLAKHTQSTACATCHARFDPVGLALENFDVMGGWRTRYRGIEQGEHISGIDRAGHDFVYTLADPVDTSGRLLDGSTFQNIRDLKLILASNPRQLARNLLSQFTLYATGTPVRFSDRREVEAILDVCANDGYRVRDLIVRLVQSRIFLGESGCRP